jgi:hypothetical protein
MAKPPDMALIITDSVPTAARSAVPGTTRHCCFCIRLVPPRASRESAWCQACTSMTSYSSSVPMPVPRSIPHGWTTFVPTGEYASKSALRQSISRHVSFRQAKGQRLGVASSRSRRCSRNARTGRPAPFRSSSSTDFDPSRTTTPVVRRRTDVRRPSSEDHHDSGGHNCEQETIDTNDHLVLRNRKSKR